MESVIEETYAQVHSSQRNKLVSETAARRSASGGFSFGQHFGAAKSIEDLWRWSAKAGTKHDPKTIQL